MLIARENYACLHISRDHEYDEYMLISGMLIARVDCSRMRPVMDSVYKQLPETGIWFLITRVLLYTRSCEGALLKFFFEILITRMRPCVDKFFF